MIGKPCRFCGVMLTVENTFKSSKSYECKQCSVKRSTEFRRAKLKSDPNYKHKYYSQMHQHRKHKLATDPEYKLRYNEYRNELQKKYIARKNPDYKPRTPAICKILSAHSESLKDDPEHLSTDFIIKLARIEKKPL